MSSRHEDGSTTPGVTVPGLLPKAVILDAVIETIVRVALASARATSAQLMLPEAGKLHLRARAKLDSTSGIVVELGASLSCEPSVIAIAQAVATSGQHLELTGAHEAAQASISHLVDESLPCSVICIPLLIEGRLVAVLYLESHRTDTAFPESIQALLAALASEMAVSIDNVHRHQTRHDERRQSALGERSSCEAQFDLSQASRITAIGEIVSSIIHEMSQPLSAIDASSGAALRWLQREAPNVEEATVSLEKVRTCTVRAKTIIDRLRELNRQAQIPFEPFDIHAAICDVILLSRTRLDKLCVELAYQPAHTTLSAFGNRVQIQQVIENLISNSLDAMADVPECARNILISYASAPSTVLISVADSGPGIAPGCEENLFRPFVTSKPQGMGMGLSICKRIVEAHGGTMWMEKVDPSGIRFSFTLESV